MAYDVAIVGGGPAGAAAATMLARAGLRILVLEQSSGAFFKVGEELPPAAKPLLRELGVWDRLAADGHAPSRGNASAWGAASLSHTQFLNDPNGHGWHLDRARFDALLRSVARDAGAHIELSARAQQIARTQTGWQLTVEQAEASMNISCRWLIDCSGRTACVARVDGALRVAHDHLVAFVALFAHSADDPDDLDSLTLVEAAPDGWWYTSRLPAGDRVVVYLTDTRDASARQARTACGFELLLNDTLHVRARIHDHRYATTEPPRIIAADTSRLDKVSGAGWIAAGDAAVSFDPLSSQGILTAIHSGIGVARALVGHFGGDQTAIPEYAARLDAIYSTYLSNQRAYYAQERRWPARPFWRSRM